MNLEDLILVEGVGFDLAIYQIWINNRGGF